MPNVVTYVSQDLRKAQLSDDRIVPVHSAYGDDFKETKDPYKATLVVVGPYQEGELADQYLVLDLTGEMNLNNH